MGMTLNEGGVQTERKVLEALQEKISKYGDESEIISHEAGEETVEILTAEFTRFGEHLDRVTGEFFFSPVPGDPDGARYFCSVLTMRDDVPLDNVPDLAFALCTLNFYMETGCFALNKPADLLAFKAVRFLPGDTEEEILFRECSAEMEQAYETASKYATVVLALAEGSLPLEKFMELLETV